jgi:hypothetical protein
MSCSYVAVEKFAARDVLRVAVIITDGGEGFLGELCGDLDALGPRQVGEEGDSLAPQRIAWMTRRRFAR